MIKSYKELKTGLYIIEVVVVAIFDDNKKCWIIPGTSKNYNKIGGIIVNLPITLDEILKKIINTQKNKSVISIYYKEFVF